MSKKPPVEKTIHLLNKNFTITCPAEEEARFEQAVYYLNQKLEKLQSSGRVIGSERLALMAALTLAHEVICQRDGRQPQTSSNEFEARLQGIKNKLEQTLSDVVK